MTMTLSYFHDPMCSWCYAFQPTWNELKSRLPDNIATKRVLGGLSPDDDAQMPESLQQTIRQHWQRIEQVVPGTSFNYEFWTKCKPRRSTYPACRAVIAAVMQNAAMEDPMIEAIQRAYYREARNPSDDSTHIELAEELQLDIIKFEQDLKSVDTERELIRQLQLTQSYNVRGFPSVLLVHKDRLINIPVDYTAVDSMLSFIIENV
jgi:putative protein-disulfide isomerase